MEIFDTLMGKFRSNGGRDDEGETRYLETDSCTLKEDILEIRTQSELNMEATLQAIALQKFSTNIKAAVFKRVKPNRGHILALIRLQGDSTLNYDPMQFLQDLVQAYNRDADEHLHKHLDFAYWGSMPALAKQEQHKLTVQFARRETA